MEKEHRPFSINPGTGMMDVLGHSGYTFNFAIADLLDNCISAHAKNIKLFFDFNSEEPYLYILDDGDGMSLDDLKNSAVIGFKDINLNRESDDLGRYSTGLKSATRSFCDDVIISSKKDGMKCNSIEIDYSHIKESKKWEAFILDSFFLENKINDHGTLVFCKRLNFSNDISLNKNVFDKLNDLEMSISHIFGKFLLAGNIKISIQVSGSTENQVKGWNPFALPENKSTKLVFKDIKKYKGHEISFKAYVLPTYGNLSKTDQAYIEGKGLIEQEGFYIYRNKRLIKEGGWLSLDKMGLDDKCKYARIDVEIPSSLDKEFDINFSKNSLSVPEELIDIFTVVANKARRESRSNFNYVKHPELKKTTKKEEERIWKTTKSGGALVLSINMEHPLIQEVSSKLSSQELKKLCVLLSKSLPLTMIQEQNTTVVSYTDNELEDLMDEMYQKMLKDGLEKKTIKSKMSKMEPFKDNLNLLIKFFDRMEEGK